MGRVIIGSKRFFFRLLFCPYFLDAIVDFNRIIHLLLQTKEMLHEVVKAIEYL